MAFGKVAWDRVTDRLILNQRAQSTTVWHTTPIDLAERHFRAHVSILANTWVCMLGIRWNVRVPRSMSNLALHVLIMVFPTMFRPDSFPQLPWRHSPNTWTNRVQTRVIPKVTLEAFPNHLRTALVMQPGPPMEIGTPSMNTTTSRCNLASINWV